VYLDDCLDPNWPVSLQLRVQLLGPQHFDTACREGAAKQRPVRLDEAEDPVDRNYLSNRAIHDVDLFEHTIHQFRAVTGADD
jgi:hypothetical protein